MTEDQCAYYETQLYDQHFRHILFADARSPRRSRPTCARSASRGKRRSASTTRQRPDGPRLAAADEHAAGGCGRGVRPPVGAISDPIRGPRRYHVFQSLEHRPRANMPAYRHPPRAQDHAAKGCRRRARRAHPDDPPRPHRHGVRHGRGRVDELEVRQGRTTSAWTATTWARRRSRSTTPCRVLARRHRPRARALEGRPDHGVAGAARVHGHHAGLAPDDEHAEAVQAQVDALVLSSLHGRVRGRAGPRQGAVGREAAGRSARRSS